VSAKEKAIRVASVHAGNDRTVWVREPRDVGRVKRLLLFLDAEIYRGPIKAVEVLNELESTGELNDTLTVFVSYQSVEARWRECPCYPPFADFIGTELVPRIEARYPSLRDRTESVLVGVSYTGLAAGYISFRHPGVFTTVIAQSGSFWSNDAWLAGEVAQLERALPTAFYLDVGNQETATNVRHKEDVLQVMSQIEGVHRFRDALLKTGHSVRTVEFDGGHDPAAWNRTLPEALRWALGRSR
jgi:enterochelin esterase family protein